MTHITYKLFASCSRNMPALSSRNLIIGFGVYFSIFVSDQNHNRVYYISETFLSFIHSSHFLMSLYLRGLALSQTSPCSYVSAGQVLRKHRGKRRNCSSRAISPFPPVFSTVLKKNLLPISSNLKLSSTDSFSLE